MIEDIDNRFTFHPADTIERADSHQAVREACKDLAILLNHAVPDGREKSLAVTKIEEAMMWANAGIARSS